MSGDPIPLDDLDGLLEERMRAYLAGPLTACDPAQVEVCRKVRTRAGRVLRSRFTVYDPAEMTPPGTDHTPDQVFNADHTRTSTADLVFFHVNAPSLGVGIESQIAAEATIPRVIAKPKGVEISRMFDGVFNPTIARIEYVDPDDFERQLLDLLQPPAPAQPAKNGAAKYVPGPPPDGVDVSKWPNQTEAADEKRCDKGTVCRAVADGELTPAYKSGREVVIDPEALKRWVPRTVKQRQTEEKNDRATEKRLAKSRAVGQSTGNEKTTVWACPQCGREYEEDKAGDVADKCAVCHVDLVVVGRRKR